MLLRASLRGSICALLGCLAAPLAGCSDYALTEVPHVDVLGPLGARDDMPVSERIVLDNLDGPVDVVRDKFGRPHIFATTLTDAMRAEGYLVARDRALQIEVFRRLSEGRMAELLGELDESLIDVDISFRHIGLHRVAKAQYAALTEGSEEKLILDAYADGISQVFAQLRAKTLALPNGIFAIDSDAFTEFTGEDTLAIARLQQYLLSYSGDEELRFDGLLSSLRSTFSAYDPDPLVASRAGIEQDLLRFAPSEDATTMNGAPSPAAKRLPPRANHLQNKGLFAHKRALAESARGYLGALDKVRAWLAPDGFGSNNWALAPSRTESGRALLASDPHLSLTAPSIFWPVSLKVTNGDELAVSGVAFPGIPGIILGHNGHVAWGATVAGYDVTDLYEETLTPDGTAVMFEGKEVKLQTIDEVIQVQGGEPVTYTVQVVPHHGPIAPTIAADHTVIPADPALGALSVRWTGHELTNDLDGILGLLRAHTVDEARTALSSFDVGAQNWMLADVNGDIAWTSHALVPTRAPGATAWDAAEYRGHLPCLVLPGDGSAEWTGFLEDDRVPWLKNPVSGYIATANNDPTGTSLDNDPTNDTLADGTPFFSACTFDIGFREARIHERIEGLDHPATPEDMAAIQADKRSAMGKRLGTRLIDALERAEDEVNKPGTYPALSALVTDPSFDVARLVAARDLLAAWRDESAYEAESGVDLETNEPLASETKEARAAAATLIFNTWLVRVTRHTFGDELARVGVGSLPRDSEAKAFLRLVEADPMSLATFDKTMGDSALWDNLDTPEVETRDERFLRAFVDALAWLKDNVGDDVLAYRWGALHTVSFAAIIPLYGSLSIPDAGDPLFSKGFPRKGDGFSVDACDYPHAVALDKSPQFAYDFGPNQRFVALLDPAAPQVQNAIPGGNVWDAESTHFRDEAELWRKNETHAVPFTLDEVAAAFETRTVISSEK